MGDWVLLTALRHTEAGELHNLSGKPRNTYIGRYPWRISIAEGTIQGISVRDTKVERTRISPQAVEKIRNAMAFEYPYISATAAPSKQTATDRKGRVKDVEAAENTPINPIQNHTWRKPSFLVKEIHGTEYGTAMHTALQYISYENCGSPDSVSCEIQRLLRNGCLSPQQAVLLDPECIARFFHSELGKKLSSGVRHLREFKFSILDDAIHYDPALEGERVLLQGVVDCALLEDDGITVIDFKTDYVTEETLPETVNRYRVQIQTYAEALEKIYEMPVKKNYLYFFRLDRFVSV